MRQAHFRFYAELNDFLHKGRRHSDTVHRFAGSPAVKDVIEALGVPHTEVDVILVNGESVPFEHSLKDADWVSVFPVFESLDVSSLVRVRPQPLRQIRFVLDVHLGRLARLLRLFGFDAAYRNDWTDRQLAEIAPRERRILLTRDRGLLMRRAITHGYCVRSIQPDDQLTEVLRRFDLSRSCQPLSRCMACNGVLILVAPDQVEHALPDDVRCMPQPLVRCPDCKRVYWDGSHVRRLRAIVAEVEGRLRLDPPGASGR